MILEGDATVRQPGEILKADRIVVDLTTRDLEATGNCDYLSGETRIQSEEMHFNMESRTGTILRGRVSNDKFALVGNRINKLGEGRFQTHWGEYSTCWDCPQSWTFQAEDVDLEFEGYAYLTNVTLRVKDVPAAWFPYLILPMKTQRQSGFLFPLLQPSGNNGFGILLPYFWAINRSADATIGLGGYTGVGPRAELEGRYALSPRSTGRANLYLFADQRPDEQRPQAGRFGLSVEQRQELPWGLEQKLRLAEVSDNLYPTQFPDATIQSREELNLTSELSLSHASDWTSFFAVGRRYRNRFNTSSDPKLRRTEFDSTTVQVMPSMLLTSNDRMLPQLFPAWEGAPKIGTGLSIGWTRFTRSAGNFDPDVKSNPLGVLTAAPNLGTDPIRKADRLYLNPRAYFSVRPADAFSLTPMAEYRGYHYSFPNQGTDPPVAPLTRGYVLLQTELATQVERVYDTDNPERPRLKHLIRPTLTYSLIPEAQIREDTKHPFIAQIANARTNVLTGYNFDSNDIVPIDETDTNQSYFTPLGNSLTFGMTTQLIRRQGAMGAREVSYHRLLEFSVQQTLNLRALKQEDPEKRRPFSRLASALSLNVLEGALVTSVSHTYSPYAQSQPHSLGVDLTVVLDRTLRHRVLSYERSFTVSYTYNRTDATAAAPGTNNLRAAVVYSLTDYLLPNASASWNAISHSLLSAGGGLLFQSPSRCWRFGAQIGYTAERPQPTWSVDIALNLTGEGFGGFGQVARETGMGGV